MQIRLFRYACKRWNRTNTECADIFDQNGVDEYITESYEIFHVQGDEANIEDIENYLTAKGVRYVAG